MSIHFHEIFKLREKMSCRTVDVKEVVRCAESAKWTITNAPIAVPSFAPSATAQRGR